MVGRKWLVLALLLAAGPAWGQSEDEITAAAGKQLDAWTLCINEEARKQAKASTLPAETIAEKAAAACVSERSDLSERLQEPPIDWTPEKAEKEIDSAFEQIRSSVLAVIKEERDS